MCLQMCLSDWPEEPVVGVMAPSWYSSVSFYALLALYCCLITFFFFAEHILIGFIFVASELLYLLFIMAPCTFTLCILLDKCYLTSIIIIMSNTSLFRQSGRNNYHLLFFLGSQTWAAAPRSQFIEHFFCLKLIKINITTFSLLIGFFCELKQDKNRLYHFSVNAPHI